MGTGGSALKAPQAKAPTLTKAAVSAGAELAGVGLIVAGFWLIAPWLGLIVGGIALILVGLAVDPPARAPRQPQSTVGAAEGP